MNAVELSEAIVEYMREHGKGNLDEDGIGDLFLGMQIDEETIFQLQYKRKKPSLPQESGRVREFMMRWMGPTGDYRTIEYEPGKCFVLEFELKDSRSIITHDLDSKSKDPFLRMMRGAFQKAYKHILKDVYARLSGR